MSSANCKKTNNRLYSICLRHSNCIKKYIKIADSHVLLNTPVKQKNRVRKSARF